MQGVEVNFNGLAVADGTTAKLFAFIAFRKAMCFSALVTLAELRHPEKKETKNIANIICKY